MPTTTTPKEATMTVTQTFKSFDGSTIQVLDNGQAVRNGVTGRMLLTRVGGEFVRYLRADEGVLR